jgi:hypothetical protein
MKVTLNEIRRMQELAGIRPLNEQRDNYKDPTKNEMMKVLEDDFGGFEGYDKFSAEEAIYWYAYDHHGGQSSNLYSALSTSKYKPSRLAKSIEDSDDDISIAMYNTLVDNFGGEEVGDY